MGMREDSREQGNQRLGWIRMDRGRIEKCQQVQYRQNYLSSGGT